MFGRDSGFDVYGIYFFNGIKVWKVGDEMRKGKAMGRIFVIVMLTLGKQVILTAKDWGPNPGTGRAIDVSYTALNALGAKTDDRVNIEFADQSASLGPVQFHSTPDYNRQAAVNYAINYAYRACDCGKYYGSSDPPQGSGTPLGSDGDCAHFVSHCLEAGGLSNKGWCKESYADGQECKRDARGWCEGDARDYIVTAHEMRDWFLDTVITYGSPSSHAVLYIGDYKGKPHRVASHSRWGIFSYTYFGTLSEYWHINVGSPGHSSLPQDHSLVRCSDDTKVYWLQNGKLYWVTDWSIINDMSSLPGWSIVNIFPSDVFNPDINRFSIGTWIKQEPFSIDMFLNIASFTTGETKQTKVTQTSGRFYTVKTYYHVKKPDGTKRYAYYPNPYFQPTDSLSFSNAKRPLHEGTWISELKTWHFDTYTFTGSEPEGQWSWELWYENVNNPSVKIASDTVTYTFTRPRQQHEQNAYLNCDGKVDSSDSGILMIYWRTGGSGATSCQSPDINQDGIDNYLDFSILKSQWTYPNKAPVSRITMKSGSKTAYENQILELRVPSGGSAEEIDGSGIGDTPYRIDSDWDYHPLTEPFENYFMSPTLVKVYSLERRL